MKSNLFFEISQKCLALCEQKNKNHVEQIWNYNIWNFLFHNEKKMF